MHKFANYKDRRLTINTYRFVDAAVTDIADILQAHNVESEEVLTASIETDEELNEIESLMTEN